jgi:hypothetical protein
MAFRRRNVGGANLCHEDVILVSAVRAAGGTAMNDR